MNSGPGVHTVPTFDRDGITALRRAIKDAFSDMGPVLPLGPNRAQPDALAHWTPFGPQGWLAAVPDNAAALLSTSGSTGDGKLVVLSTDAIQASATATHEFLQGPGQWILALPPHNIAGFQVVARSVFAETTPAVVPPGHFSSEAFLDAVSGLPTSDLPRYVSLVPTQLGRLLKDAEATAALKTFSSVLIGGAALPDAWAEQASDAGINLVHTYGMSETAGGCVYDGRPLNGVQWRLDDVSQVWLTGPMLAEGYLGEPELTAQSFVSRDGQRWFRTADVGRESDGGLEILGRADDMIISGGVNVPPTRVEAALVKHEAVDSVAVVATPHAEWGQQVTAVITRTDQSQQKPLTEVTGPLAEELRDLVRSDMGRSAAPKTIFEIGELPHLPGGKVDRQSVVALAVDHDR